MPGVMIIEALAQTAGILAFVTADVVPDEIHAVLLRRHRQGALSQAGGAGRPADPHREARAPAMRGIWKFSTVAYVGDDEVTLGGNDGGARNQQDVGKGNARVADRSACHRVAAGRACDGRVGGPVHGDRAGRDASARAPGSGRTR